MRLIVLFFVVSLLVAASVASAESIKYGKWEMTMKVSMPGMPVDMPAVTNTQCLTKENMTPQAQPPEHNCDTESHVEGNTAHYSVTCETDEGTMQGNGTATYTGDTMTGSMHMVMDGENGMEMTQEFSGRYLGPCDE